MTRAAARSLQRQFLDVAVIYPSPNEKGKWVAHSIETDQIGVGECVLDAYVELLRAVRALLSAAERDSSIQVLRRAPDEVCAMLMTARKLPDEIVEIAALQVDGQFAATLDTPWTPAVKALSAPVTVRV
jgi:hypothetical protein